MRRMHSERPRAASGFTLIEAIIVITITGILFTMVGLFIRLPVSGAVDTARRASMVDSADLALRRLKREIQSALPNSVRVTTVGSAVYIEFIPILAGGRYCSAPDVPGTCSQEIGSTADSLDFTQADASFEVIGPLVSQPNLAVTATTELAIFNLGIPGEQAGMPGASAYDVGNANNNVSRVTGIATSGNITTIGLVAKQFPFESPGRRFHIIGAPVSYVCTEGSSGANGSGALTRLTGYVKQAAQPTTFPTLSGTNNVLLLENIAGCKSVYTQALSDRYGLLGMTVQLKRENEIVTLSHAIQINNVP